MKNHIKVNGKVIQTNKKWRDLKEKQKEAISNMLRNRYVEAWNEKEEKPTDKEAQDMLVEVYAKIEEKEINISFSQVSGYFSSKKQAWNVQEQKKIEAKKKSN